MPNTRDRIHTERFQLRLDPETVTLLDQLRREADDPIPSRADIIRRLIHEAAERSAARLPSVRDLVGATPRKRK